MSQHEFQTEVSQLLDLIIHSLYSHKEIFLRELISNSSDALDKLKYLALTEEKFKKLDFVPRIDIEFNKDANTITVRDTGIGMNDEDLVENLGTIARSGTRRFLQNISGDQKKDSNLIGQFGVGFYSCYMVADRVDVLTKKAGEEKGWKWTSDGRTGYDIEPIDKNDFGTTVILYLNDEGTEYASRWEIENIVKKYSNHIAFPIYLHYTETKTEGEGEDKKETKEDKTEQINSASAMWKRSKSELKEEDYKDFYKNLTGDSEDPLLYLHTQAEGTLEYTTLFYVPKHAPFDMYQADYQPGVKLYVKRVFITDDDKELMPVYLRFVKGVIDSEDLPLNVSREILQQNKVLANIRSTSVKKLLGEFKKLSENKDKYAEFIEQYNRPLKEGLYSDYTNREALLELVRFKSTKREGWVSLAEYVADMKEDQKVIYYITGEDEETLRKSPLIEAYAEKDIEVLIMDDEVDEIVVPAIGRYEEKELKSVNRSNAAEDLKTEEDKQQEKKIEPVVKKVKKALGDKVKDVVASSRLSGSPSCIVADENDPTMQMQHMLKAMGQKNIPEIKPILEINPSHPIVTKLENTKVKKVIEDVSFLLLQQALLVEGAEMKKPADFVARLNRILEKAL